MTAATLILTATVALQFVANLALRRFMVRTHRAELRAAYDTVAREQARAAAAEATVREWQARFGFESGKDVTK